jgi:hypothetical protein
MRWRQEQAMNGMGINQHSNHSHIGQYYACSHMRTKLDAAQHCKNATGVCPNVFTEN